MPALEEMEEDEEKGVAPPPPRRLALEVEGEPGGDIVAAIEAAISSRETYMMVRKDR